MPALLDYGSTIGLGVLTIAGILTSLLPPDNPKARRFVAAVVLLVGGMAIAFDVASKWEGQARLAERSDMREQLGGFVIEGQTLFNACIHQNDADIAVMAADWYDRTATALARLGASYVGRFVSSTGILPLSWDGLDKARSGLCNGVRGRVENLKSILVEFSN